MSVIRYDLNNCIGCKNCVTVCPMDVFRFDENEMKSVIAYPENCQSCGQCFVGRRGRRLRLGKLERLEVDRSFGGPRRRAAGGGLVEGGALGCGCEVVRRGYALPPSTLPTV